MAEEDKAAPLERESRLSRSSPSTRSNSRGSRKNRAARPFPTSYRRPLSKLKRMQPRRVGTGKAPSLRDGRTGYTSPECRARSKPRAPRALSTLILHETRGHGAIDPHHELMSRRPAPLLTYEAAEKKRALRN